MTHDDLPKVKSLMQSLPGLWHDVWDDENLESAFDSAGDLALVYENDGRIAGFVLCHDVGFRAYLSTLAVAEDMQKQGIGSGLLHRAESILKKRGRELIISDVWIDAESFYKKQGWARPQSILLRKWL